MEASSLFVAFGGMVAGAILVSALSRWARVISEARRTEPLAHRWRRVALVSLLSSGPWVLVAFGIFTYYEHSAPWVPWFFGGVVVWVVYVAVLISIVWRKHRNKARNAA